VGEVTWEGIAALRASLIIEFLPSICAVARVVLPPGPAVVALMVVPLPRSSSSSPPLWPLKTPCCGLVVVCPSLWFQNQNQNQNQNQTQIQVRQRGQDDGGEALAGVSRGGCVRPRTPTRGSESLVECFECQRPIPPPICQYVSCRLGRQGRRRRGFPLFQKMGQDVTRTSVVRLRHALPPAPSSAGGHNLPIRGPQIAKRVV
jgi:hypothetical protein